MMTGWYVDVRDESGTRSFNESFPEVKARVAARKSGETITFTPPLDAPRAEIDERVRMRARKTLP
jgi:hypothetical protein